LKRLEPISFRYRYNQVKNSFLFEIWLQIDKEKQAILVLSQPFQKKNMPYPKFIEKGNFTNLLEQI
jgi:hypothetical protein